MATITFYINEEEKARFHELAKAQKISNAKLASTVVREWVQARMPDEDEEYYYEE